MLFWHGFIKQKLSGINFIVQFNPEEEAAFRLADLGISWHMLADGDEAGIRYIHGARRLLSEEHQHGGGLTLLPNRDIEHFLYMHGFADVYRREAALRDLHNLPANKIIERAVSRRSKPGMALAVIEEAMQRGVDSVPSLLKNMFDRVIDLARQQA